MKALFYIVILLTVSGCGFSNSNLVLGLDEAQMLLADDPAEAFEKLNAYDVAEFSDSATMARWALLYSEAMVANHLSAPTDTIINIAINYYGGQHEQASLDKARQIKAKLQESTGKADSLTTALYIQKEKEFMLFKEKTKKKQLIFVVLLAAIIAASIIAWQRQRLRLADARNESLMAEASSLKDVLTLQKSECSRLNEKLSASLTNRFGIIDGLCETYYESQGTKIEKKAIVDKVKSQIEALKADNGIFTDMEKCHEELLLKLRGEIPGLKQEEYRLMVYLASGLSNRTIALLIGESIDVVYKRKSRLKAKISESGAPEKGQFLAIF